MKLDHHWDLCLFASVLHPHLAEVIYYSLLRSFRWNNVHLSFAHCSPENGARFLFPSLELDVSFIHNLSSTIATITVSLAPEMDSQIQQSLHYQHTLGVAFKSATENIAVLSVQSSMQCVCVRGCVCISKLTPLKFISVLASLYISGILLETNVVGQQITTHRLGVPWANEKD